MFSLLISQTSDVISIIRTILAGVKYLHAMGIVHRGKNTADGSTTEPDYNYHSDLKPDNVLFASPGDDSKIIIGDFGLSRLLESSKLSLLTHCGTLAVSSASRNELCKFAYSVSI